MLTGGCLCGAVRFAIEGPAPPPLACHCSQCRKQSGHVWAATDCPREALTVDGAEALNWYRSSESAERGFCRVCGSFLFWRGDGATRVDVAMGALDAPTGLTLAGHIWTADKGDYYDIADGIPQQKKEEGQC
ncbi:aldehyde-activating protein [Maritimibacter sp. 55A14]|uniref:GFA family protein n=1 Tax=Maritimibacter sp. 55A14 TaxID=2174844 RepID=UPI000D61D5C1|nr:GFA family protein [Maritimibacter sp. 55A14]PWE29322.1 aldehyde-activating protein [Maritimibacter sp. 55A14]